jgi:SOS-response transcriptional repressor LexA
MEPLTPRQRDALEAIRTIISETGCSPSIQEIANRLGNSKSATSELVDILIRKKHVERVGDQRRGLVICGQDLIPRKDAIRVVDSALGKKSPSDTVGNAHEKIVAKLKSIKGRT